MNASSHTLLVIGAGHAGAEAAVAARQAGFAGEIILIGDEATLPYHRPPLSKGYLQGTATAESLQLKPQAAYDKAGVTLRLGVRAVRIDRLAQLVELSDGSTQAYTRLIIATGSRARAWQAPGLEAGVRPSNLYYLRTATDVDAMRTHFEAGKRLVLIGAGYIGLEVASAARSCGMAVTVLETAPRVLARVTAPEVSAFYTALHQQHGVDVRLSAEVRRVLLDAAGRTVTTLETADGARLDADLVIVGVGVLPNQELAEAAGLEIDNGIATDEYLRTSDPAIFAIGDCSSHPSQVYGRRLRLESVPNALEQSRIAAANVCDGTKTYASVPWFWSEQYNLKLQMVGLLQGYDEVVMRGDPAAQSFAVFYLREGAVISADCVNRPLDFVTLKKLVTARAVVKPELLADESVPLKELAA